PGSGVLPDAQRLPEDAARKALTYARVAAALGIVACIGGYLSDPQRLAYAYLTGFAFTATIAAPPLFFILLQHLTRAGWSVAARRVMEWFASALPTLIVLFIPVILFAPTTYHAWWGGAHGVDPDYRELLEKKEVWLNPTGFIARGFVYILIFSLLGWWFSKNSSKQDETGAPALTIQMPELSVPLMLVFALTISFAGFDWLMSLQPFWYSTIFGVYTFAGAFVSSLAVLALITLQLAKSGLYKRVSTVEH